MEKELSQISQEVVPTTDNISYRMVVGGLVIVLCAIVACYITLPALGKEVPNELGNMAIGIIGGLMGILSPIKK